MGRTVSRPTSEGKSTPRTRETRPAPRRTPPARRTTPAAKKPAPAHTSRQSASAPATGRRSQARLGKTRTFDTAVAQPVMQPMRANVGQSVQKARARLLGGLGLAILAAALCFLFISPSFFVWGAEITGSRWLTQDELYTAAGVDGVSIFYVDPVQVRLALEALPGVQQAQVACGLPNRLTIGVVERQPAAIWQNQNVQYWVDRTGMIFPLRANLQEPVVIVDMDPEPVQPGTQVDAQVIATALALYVRMPDVRVFGYQREEGLSFDWMDGARVRMAVGADAGATASTLHALQAQFAEEDEEGHTVTPKSIDLRYDHRVIWR